MVLRRARVNRLEKPIQLQKTARFEEVFEGRTFDTILGHAALDHLPWDGLAYQIYRRLRPGGVAVFAEPVVNSKLLAALRGCIPYAINEPTVDERPLNDRMIADFARPFARLVRREFQLLSRIWCIWPLNWPLCVALHQMDGLLLKWRALRPFATVVVFAVYRDR